jgi:hypothetical protein
VRGGEVKEEKLKGGSCNGSQVRWVCLGGEGCIWQVLKVGRGGVQVETRG